MKLSTQSELRHHTTLLAASRDGLAEMLDELRSQRSTGTLTVSFNQGGITSAGFEERVRMSQRELEARDAAYFGTNGNGNGHLATTGATKVLDSAS